MSDRPSRRRYPPLPAVLSLILLAATSVTVSAAFSAAGGRAPAATVTADVAGMLQRSSAPLGGDGSPALQARRLAGIGAPDSLHVIVLMCDFADSLLYGRYGQVPGDFPPPRQSDFYYTAHDSLYFDYQFRDVRAYFDAASGGRFHLGWAIHGEATNLPHPMRWYGNDPVAGEQKVLLAKDAITALDADVDFAGFDTVVLIHAGAGEETDILGNSPEQIYSSYLGPEDFAAAAADSILSQPWIATGDSLAGEPVVIRNVLILPENEFQDPVGNFTGYFGSLGVYCFEVGLRLGMLSLSDFTPAGNPDSQGIGEFGLMGYGLFVGAGIIPDHPCAFNKMLMGWLEPYVVDPDAGAVCRLYPAETAGADSTLARIDIAPQEYWLLEYRLQDPDGNRIFTLPGDLNGNNIPDFYDADSDSGDGRPTGWFDPATDQREWLDGSEFDFFMSDNDARAQGVKGAGSGIYVWHVDESVIRNAFGADGNYYEADPAHKAVDVEEADGIQDLDSRTPTLWMFGGDNDSFRAEGAARFGPDTRPATDTAAGLPTGIVVEDITAVVADSSYVAPGDSVAVIGYEPWMEFRCTRSPVVEAADATTTLELPGRDLRGMHLVAADLDDPADGTREIVAAADGGRVLAWRWDLTDFVEGAAEPGLLAAGIAADGGPARWTGPPLIADLDDDGRPEIVLTADDGLYAFHGENGSELGDEDGDPTTVGRLLALTHGAWSPVVDADGRVYAVEDDPAGGQRLRSWPGGGLFDWEAVADVVAPPVIWDGAPALLCAGPDGDEPELRRPTLGDALALDAVPSGLAPTAFATGLLVPTVAGAEMVAPDLVATVWPDGADVRTPAGPGPSFGRSGGAFSVTGFNGAPREGWPRRPRFPAADFAAGTAPQPLAFDLAGVRYHLFTLSDGRLFLLDDRGVLQPGWPLAGAGTPAGTPLLADLDGVPGLELVAAGSFARIDGYDTDGGLAEAPRSRLEVWSLPGTAPATAVWPMYGGGPDRNAPAPGPLSAPGGSGLIAAGSHVCYPSPLTGNTLHVRADVVRDCQVRVFLYNLEGELVAATPARTARSGDPIDVPVAMAGVASGMYLCRLVAEAGGNSETSVRPVAVAR